MKRRRTLIASPLAWQLTAAPVPPPVVPVLAERGGTQLKVPRPVLLIDTREQNPFDFSRFAGWFAGIEKKALKIGDYSVNMKTVGIIGGIGPESTIEYYRAIIAAYREQREDRDYPSIIINSISVNKLLGLMHKNDLTAVTDLLVAEVGRLARAGADFALFASNTPHIVFDQVQQRSPIPLLSIVQATCDAAKALGLKTVGLFGTGFTMQARFYPEVFAREGITVIVPAPDEQAFIHEKYMVELLNNIILPDTRDRLLAIVESMKARDGIQGLILGGTELPLILRDGSASGIPFLDTTQIHARAAAVQMLV